MGILMLIFGGLGILGALIGLVQSSVGMGMPQQGLPAGFLEKMRQFQRIGNLVSLPLASLQLYAGYSALKYKRSTQLLSNSYAGFAIVWVIVSMVLMYSWVMPMMEKMVPGGAAGEVKGIVTVAFFVGAFFGMIWPVLILILMNRPTARESCVN